MYLFKYITETRLYWSDEKLFRVMSVDLDGNDMRVIFPNNGMLGAIKPVNMELYGPDDDIIFLDRARDELIGWRRRDNTSYVAGKGNFQNLFDLYIPKCKCNNRSTSCVHNFCTVFVP